jgi:hypothetical protein
MPNLAGRPLPINGPVKINCAVRSKNFQGFAAVTKSAVDTLFLYSLFSSLSALAICTVLDL